MLKNQQPLRDGHLKVYRVEDISDPGEVPKPGLTLLAKLPYDERVVGMARYWTAKQASATIDVLVRTHQRRDITTHDVVILRDGKQYDIVQVQYLPDTEPPMMDLSLQRRADAYDVEVVADV